MFHRFHRLWIWWEIYLDTGFHIRSIIWDALTNPCPHFWTWGFSEGPTYASSNVLKIRIICSNIRFLAIVESFLQIGQFSILVMQSLQTKWPLAHWCIGADLIGSAQTGQSKRLLMYSSNCDPPCSDDSKFSEFDWIFRWTLGPLLGSFFEKDALTDPCSHFWSSCFLEGPSLASSYVLKFPMICSNTRFLTTIESFLQIGQYSNLVIQSLQTTWPLVHWCIGADLIDSLQAGHFKRHLTYSSNSFVCELAILIS